MSDNDLIWRGDAIAVTSLYNVNRGAGSATARAIATAITSISAAIRARGDKT